MVASMMVVLQHHMLKTLLEHVHANKEQEDGVEQSKQDLEPLHTTLSHEIQKC